MRRHRSDAASLCFHSRHFGILALIAICSRVILCEKLVSSARIEYEIRTQSSIKNIRRPKTIGSCWLQMGEAARRLQLALLHSSRSIVGSAYITRKHKKCRLRQQKNSFCLIMNAQLKQKKRVDDDELRFRLIYLPSPFSSRQLKTENWAKLRVGSRFLFVCRRLAVCRAGNRSDQLKDSRMFFATRQALVVTLPRVTTRERESCAIERLQRVGG